MMPAMASDPYCAEAPSRSTSNRSRAMAGIAERSGPCAPPEIPAPSSAITAARWRRLPFASTSVASGANPRSVAGRMNVAASLIGSWLTLYDGTKAATRASRSVSPWARKASPAITSTGTGESAAERSWRREPTTINSSMSPAASAFSSLALCAALGAAMPNRHGTAKAQAKRRSRWQSVDVRCCMGHLLRVSRQRHCKRAPFARRRRFA